MKLKKTYLWLHHIAVLSILLIHCTSTSKWIKLNDVTEAMQQLIEKKVKYMELPQVSIGSKNNIWAVVSTYDQTWEDLKKYGVEEFARLQSTSNEPGPEKGTEEIFHWNGKSWQGPQLSLTGDHLFVQIGATADGSVFILSSAKQKTEALYEKNGIWKHVSSFTPPQNSQGFYMFTAASKSSFYVNNKDNIWHGNGSSWQKIPHTPKHIQRIHAGADNSLLVSTRNPYAVLHLFDGASWQKLPEIPGNPYYVDMAIGDKNNIWISFSGPGFSGYYVYQFDPLRQAWIDRSLPEDERPYIIAAFADGTAIVRSLFTDFYQWIPDEKEKK